MQPLPVDTHIHTIYCGHASEDMLVANILKAARDKGLEAIAITEHLHRPHDRGRLDRILADLRKEQAPCEVYLGAEIDADGLAEDGSLVTEAEGLAYVIASTHHYPGGKFWWYDTPELTADERAQVVERWFTWAGKVVANPRVCTFAHPGILVSRNGLTDAYEGAVLDGFRRLFAQAAEHDTMVELNELIAKKLTPRHQETYPDLMRAARESGCKLVLASDAHQPAAVGRFEWTVQVAEALGLEAADFSIPAWRADPVARPEVGHA
ncbi:MAG: PHP domain-containing protein [Armatimonadetes bacterium]|nr:PHP domain-containing protein [Armatimonadota bacterium]